MLSTIARPARAVLALTIALSSTSAIANAERAAFPTVSGHNLNGRAVEIPHDLAGNANLVYVAFLPAQQAEVDSWQPFAAELGRLPSFRAYQLPIISNAYTVMRGFLDNVMRGAIEDSRARDSTITLFLDKGKFERELGIASEGEISVFLIRPSGQILWRATGAFDPAKPPGIAKFLAPPVPPH